MRAAVMYKAYDIRIENVPDAAIQNPTDAVIRIIRACICGSDLWPYNGGPNENGQRMGHEAIGIVEDVGSAVQSIRRGQLVIMPFAFASSDGSC
jgi:threonine dehydrogenase-like Zn-dependent dehydrogenase